jgi:hypothetical protein
MAKEAYTFFLKYWIKPSIIALNIATHYRFIIIIVPCFHFIPTNIYILYGSSRILLKKIAFYDRITL